MVIKAQNLFLEFRAKHLKNTVVPDWMLQKRQNSPKPVKIVQNYEFFAPNECSIR